MKVGGRIAIIVKPGWLIRKLKENRKRRAANLREGSKVDQKVKRRALELMDNTRWPLDFEAFKRVARKQLAKEGRQKRKERQKK